MKTETENRTFHRLVGVEAENIEVKLVVASATSLRLKWKFPVRSERRQGHAVSAAQQNSQPQQQPPPSQQQQQPFLQREQKRPSSGETTRSRQKKEETEENKNTRNGNGAVSAADVVPETLWSDGVAGAENDAVWVSGSWGRAGRPVKGHLWAAEERVEPLEEVWVARATTTTTTATKLTLASPLVPPLTSPKPPTPPTPPTPPSRAKSSTQLSFIGNFMAKVEWSQKENFAKIEGTAFYTNATSDDVIAVIHGLVSGKRYFCRVSFQEDLNSRDDDDLVGYGVAVLSTPPSAIPSSWSQAKEVVDSSTVSPKSLAAAANALNSAPSFVLNSLAPTSASVTPGATTPTGASPVPSGPGTPTLGDQPASASMPEMSVAGPHAEAATEMLYELRNVPHDFVNFEGIRMRPLPIANEMSFATTLAMNQTTNCYLSTTPPSSTPSSATSSKAAKWRSHSAKSTLKDLFGANPKFLKGLKPDAAGGDAVFVNVIVIDGAGRVLTTPDLVTPLLRVSADASVWSSSAGGADDDPLSQSDLTWLRRMAYSGWKDLKLHLAELESLQSRSDLAGVGPNLSPTFDRRLAVLQTIAQAQNLLGGLSDLGKLAVDRLGEGVHHNRRRKKTGKENQSNEPQRHDLFHRRVLVLHLIVDVPEDARLDPSVAAGWGGQWIDVDTLVKQKRRLSLTRDPPTTTTTTTLPPPTSQSWYRATEAMLHSLPTLLLPRLRSALTPLPSGLYLAFLQLSSGLHGVDVFASTSHPSMLPVVRVRDESHVTLEEWELLRRWGREAVATKNQALESFQASVLQAARKLLKDELKLPVDGWKSEDVVVDAPFDSSRYAVFADFRLFVGFVVQLAADVAVIVVTPPVPLAVLGPGVESPLDGVAGVTRTPMRRFEELNAFVYTEAFIRQFGRLSSLLETLKFVVSKHERISLVAFEDASSATNGAVRESTPLETLESMEARLRKSWNRVRWLQPVVDRLRQKSGSVNAWTVPLKAPRLIRRRPSPPPKSTLLGGVRGGEGGREGEDGEGSVERVSGKIGDGD